MSVDRVDDGQPRSHPVPGTAAARRAHLVQLNIVWEDHAANFSAVDALLARAPVVPGDLVVLPEMFSTGFSLNTGVTADRSGVVLEYLRALAIGRGVWVQGGRTVLEDGDSLASNEATVVDPSGTVLCAYQKIHPFTFGREPERFSGGDEVMVYRWGG